MQLTTHSKNYVMGDKLLTILNRKLDSLQRYFDDNATCVVACTRIGKTDKMEITVTQKGRMFRAEATSNNMFANIDLVLSKLERQIIKNKEKLVAVLRAEGAESKKSAYFTKVPKFIETEIVKQKSFIIEKMEPAEAELAMDTIGHSFYVYANNKNGKVNIMYRRTDGNVGIIEIENSKTS